MSQLLGGTGIGPISTKDRRLTPVYQVIRKERDLIAERGSGTEYPGGYTNVFWPGCRQFVGDNGLDVGMIEPIFRGPVARIALGAGSRVGFVGVTRDAQGAPLGGVTCSLFRTATREWIMDIVSGVDGSFLLQSWYSPDAHFIVFSKTGAPDVFGTTKQTLVGA